MRDWLRIGRRRIVGEPIEATISEALREVYDPCCKDKGISVVDMGLLHHAELDGGVARVGLLLTSGWCPFASRVLTDVESVLRSLPEVAEV
jgi:metal-sulfur cluster biosynthetic enzyme